MAPPSSIAAGVKSDRAHTIVTNYSKIAHSKLCHHFEPKFGTRIAKEKAFDLLGSVIGRSCSTFNKSMPAEYRRVGVRASVDNVITDTLSYSIE
jgi:hypothetical protein